MSPRYDWNGDGFSATCISGVTTLLNAFCRHPWTCRHHLVHKQWNGTIDELLHRSHRNSQQRNHVDHFNSLFSVQRHGHVGSMVPFVCNTRETHTTKSTAELQVSPAFLGSRSPASVTRRTLVRCSRWMRPWGTHGNTPTISYTQRKDNDDDTVLERSPHVFRSLLFSGACRPNACRRRGARFWAGGVSQGEPGVPGLSGDRQRGGSFLAEKHMLTSRVKRNGRENSAEVLREAVQNKMASRSHTPAFFFRHVCFQCFAQLVARDIIQENVGNVWVVENLPHQCPRMTLQGARTVRLHLMGGTRRRKLSEKVSSRVII